MVLSAGDTMPFREAWRQSPCPVLVRAMRSIDNLREEKELWHMPGRGRWLIL